MTRASSSPSDKGHFCRHHCHAQHVRIKREIGHVEHGIGDVLYIHHRLDGNLSIRLRHALGHPRGEISAGIANIDLPTGNIVLSPIQRCRFGESREGMLGGGVRS